MEAPQTSTYTIEQVYLSKTSFTREAVIDFQNLAFGQETIVNQGDTYHEAGKNKFVVQVTVKVVGKVANVEVITIEVTTAGVFHRNGETALDEETFKNVNAPAIIYPFVREHIATVALKAGIGSLLLPPVNFTNR